MDQATHIQVRAARDRVIELLKIGKTYPLQDLPVGSVIVPYDSVGEIPVHESQVDVEYELHDMDNQPVRDSGDARNRRFWQKGNGKTVFLETPAIQGNVKFKIRALKKDPERAVYLHQPAIVSVGLDTSLRVTILPQPGGDPQSDSHIIQYGVSVDVSIENSQDRVEYCLVCIPKDQEHTEVELLSEMVQGNLSTIVLRSSPVFEDTELRVRATKNFPDSDGRKAETALLDTLLPLKVMPNPELQLEPHLGNVIDFGASETVKLVGAQSSAEYELYQRVFAPTDYVTQETEDNLEISTGQDSRVFVKQPEKIINWDDPADFESLGLFVEDGNEMSAVAAGLREDTLMIVKATKKENKQSVQLDRAVVVLVRPNPEPTLAVEQRQHGDWKFHAVTVTDTQKGVAYQLRLDKDNQPVNPPGYHYEDRSVENTRLEVDFVIEAEAEPLLLLPTGALTQKTTFNVLATKSLSGISVPLKATIEVSPAGSREK